MASACSSDVAAVLAERRGPVIALLLAGPALSLPNMIVLWKLMGGKKTVAFCSLIVVMSTIAGLILGPFL